MAVICPHYLIITTIWIDVEPAESKFIGESFDYIIVGSSPLMLLQSIALASDGHRVCVLDRERVLGGSWQTHSMDIDFNVEVACHLIEVFPDVYECLSNASGVPFVPLVEQPIRVHKLGFIFPYSSRALVLAAGIRLLFGYILTYVAGLVLRKSNKSVLLNFKTKLKSFWLYQRSIILGKPIMKAPKSGFVDFLRRLINNCESRGVQFLEFDVKSINLKDGMWCVSDQQGNILTSRHINSTTSTNLRHVEMGRFESIDYKLVPRISVLVLLPRNNVLKNQSYVAFWKDPWVTRISRIDQLKHEEEWLRYLVEVRSPIDETSETLNTILRKALERSDILKPGMTFSNLGVIKCHYTENIAQLPEGVIDEGFTCFYSFGNLAAGIAHWLDLRQRK
jgi:hypothetical protein